MKFISMLLCLGLIASASAWAEDAELQSSYARMSLAGAKIKSMSDLHAYDFSVPEAANPIAKLSPAARQRFVESLTFNERGITGFGIADLRSELSVEQIYDVLSLFGVQNDIGLLPDARISTKKDREIMAQSALLQPIDYRNYKCATRATCRRDFDHICTSNCFD